MPPPKQEWRPGTQSGREVSESFSRESLDISAWIFITTSLKLAFPHCLYILALDSCFGSYLVIIAEVEMVNLCCQLDDLELPWRHSSEFVYKDISRKV